MSELSPWTVWSQTALGLIFPRDCVWCEVPLPSVAPWGVCAACYAGFLGPSRPECPQCGEVLPPSAPADDPAAGCPACRRNRFRFDGVFALGPYDDPLRQAVMQTKHPGQGPLSGALIELLVDRHRQRLTAADIDWIVPVPMHWARRWARMTNGPELLAARLGELLSLPVRHDVVRRVRWTAPQGRLSPPARRENVRGAFALGRRWRASGERRERPLQGRRILVVDDVITSGATSHEIAKLLKRHGAQQVLVAAIARAQSGRGR